MSEPAVVDVAVFVYVIVVGPVIAAVHVNVNPTVEVIATAIRCCSGRTVAGMDHGHGIVHVQVHVNDHGFDHDHLARHGVVTNRETSTWTSVVVRGRRQRQRSGSCLRIV